MFENISIFNIEKNIKDYKNIYAHTKEECNHKERLDEHINLSREYFLKIVKDKKLERALKNIENQLLPNGSSEEIKIFREMLINVICMHDIGKINKNFQVIKMKNNRFNSIQETSTDHSLVSSLIYLDYFFDIIGKSNISSEIREKLLVILLVNSYIISKHHGNLGEFKDFEDNIQKTLSQFNQFNVTWDLYFNGISICEKRVKIIFNFFREFLNKHYKGFDGIGIYIYSKLIFSLLVASDFYSTSEYVGESKIDEIGILNNLDEMYSEYKEQDVYKYIKKYKENQREIIDDFHKVKEINILRSEMFLEAEENLIKNIDSSIFYLEAPTGSGKTNTSINLAFKLLEDVKNLNKIIYVFPFNTLVEQTKKSISEIFRNKKDIRESIVVLNSITPIKKVYLEENKEIDYSKTLLDRNFMHYPFVLTSHVKLFDILFGTGREETCSLYQLCNSVIILDEIQSYKNIIWKEIITFLQKYSTLLNIKVIIMSATLPELSKLLNEKTYVPSLIENKDKYFKNPLFKNRVKIDYSLLKSEDISVDLMEKVLEKDNEKNKYIVVEFIKKKSANNFYNSLCEMKKEETISKEIYLLTGDDNKAEREKIISKIKNGREKQSSINYSENNLDIGIILVATQVIEAGVDIDMDYGFKDISILDSEEQFLGRVNRSCKRDGCKVYFFNLDNPSLIYKGDFRKNTRFTLENDEMKKVLINKTFSLYYNELLEAINDHKNKENEDGIIVLIDALKDIDYKEIHKKMKLIDDDRYTMTVFLNIKVEINKNGKKEILYGEDVWREFESIVKNNRLDYAERKVKLSEINEKMDYFTYEVESIGVSNEGNIGDMYYLGEGEKYFTNGKFDKNKVCNKKDADSMEFI